jgi:hypothetical protein
MRAFRLPWRRTFSLRALWITVSVLCVAFAVWAYVPDPNNTLPMARIVPREKLQEVKNSKQPQLIWLSEETVVSSSGSRQRYWLAIVNPTNQTLHYHGYKMDSWEHRPSSGEISPFISYEYETTAGWTPVKMGYCGTGAGDLDIKPGHAGKFDMVNFERHEPFRVRVGYTLTTNGRPSGGGTLVSEPWPKKGT